METTDFTDYTDWVAWIVETHSNASLRLSVPAYNQDGNHRVPYYLALGSLNPAFNKYRLSFEIEA